VSPEASGVSPGSRRFSRSAKGRLTLRDADRFPGNSLFDNIARAVCKAGCLPRKELYEAWEVARRVRRLFRGGRVVDVGGGHGLLAHMMLLLDDTSPGAVVVDPVVPPSCAMLRDTLTKAWPRLDGRVEVIDRPISDIAVLSTDVVVSSHACGDLTDRILDVASAVGARLAILPCCHDFRTCDAGPLAGWMDPALAIDTLRALRLESRGYRVWTQSIPADVTPKNRLLLGAPNAAAV
jgi:hypothetical protein